MSKGKEKILEDDLDDDQESEFQLEEHDDEPRHHTHHGVEIIDLESQDETAAQNMLMMEKDTHIRMLMDTISRGRYIITYL